MKFRIEAVGIPIAVGLAAVGMASMFSSSSAVRTLIGVFLFLGVVVGSLLFPVRPRPAPVVDRPVEPVVTRDDVLIAKTERQLDAGAAVLADMQVVNQKSA